MIMIQNTPKRPDPERRLLVLPYDCREDQAVILTGAVVVRGAEVQLVLAREALKKAGDE